MSGLRLLPAVLLAWLAPWQAQTAPPPAPALPRDSVYQFDAEMTDSEGRSLAFRDLRGQPRLVTMFYTQCKFVCPLIIDSVKAVERELTEAERGRLGFVLISIDPARDTAQALGSVRAQRRLDPAHWLLLRPDPEDLRGLAGVLAIRYRALADGEFNHTAALVLLDAEGRVVARSDRLGGRPEPEFMNAVHGLLVHPEK